MFLLIVLGSLGFIGLVLFLASFFTVEQQTVRMVTRFGSFKRVAGDGPHFRIPFVDGISRPLSLRTQQHNVAVDSITRDKVTLKLNVSVQFEVIAESAREAFYRLANPEQQIESYVFDAVRSTVPEMDLDEVFQNKNRIATAVERELRADMQQFGFRILKALVTEVTPDAKVVAAMNEINANQRLQVAAAAKGEAEKILIVKQAEAEAEQKRLRGEGVAAERTAIAKGIKESASLIKDALGQGLNPEHVMDILLTTQGYDAMRDIGGNAKATVVFLPNSARGMQELLSATTAGPIIANAHADAAADAEENPKAL